MKKVLLSLITLIVIISCSDEMELNVTDNSAKEEVSEITDILFKMQEGVTDSEVNNLIANLSLKLSESFEGDPSGYKHISVLNLTNEDVESLEQALKREDLAELINITPLNYDPSQSQHLNSKALGARGFILPIWGQTYSLFSPYCNTTFNFRYQITNTSQGQFGNNGPGFVDYELEQAINTESSISPLPTVGACCPTIVNQHSASYDFNYAAELGSASSFTPAQANEFLKQLACEARSLMDLYKTQNPGKDRYKANVDVYTDALLCGGCGLHLLFNINISSYDLDYDNFPFLELPE